jgi:uncharacterized membrane protein
MQNTESRRQNKDFITGLIVLVSIYSAYYLLVADNNGMIKKLLLVTHSIKILVVFAIYLSGTYFLSRLPQKWLKQLWHFIHIVLISMLIGLWSWHFAVHPLPLNLRNFGYSIHEFLISPLLYLATWLMGKLA